MVVEVKAGVWRTRAGEVVTVRPHEKGCGWFGSDGHDRWDDGRYFKTTESYLDLVAFVSLPEPEPQPEPEPEPEPEPVQPPRHEAEQPDAADTLTALREWAYTLGGMLANANEANNSLTTQLSTLEARAEKAEHSLSLVSDERDGMESRLQETREERDVWQTRAVQAEGRVKTLGQELQTAQRYVSDVNEANNRLTTQVSTLQCGCDMLQQQLATARQQLQDRDAADQVPGNEQLRQQITQLNQQIQADALALNQAETDARQAAAKLRHHEHAAARWETYSQEKNNLLLKAEGAANALQLAILNIVREVANHDD